MRAFLNLKKNWKVVWRSRFSDISGFTLTELMMAVAVIAILAAVAVPAYMGYLRRSYLNEVSSSFAALKAAEESYFNTGNNCYISVDANPATVPSNAQAVTWTNPAGAWSALMGTTRLDRVVRFQYQVYASNQYSATAAGGCGTAETKAATYGCVAANALVPDTIYGSGSNWYVVVARGDLDGDGVTSNILSAIDDSNIMYCDELE